MTVDELLRIVNIALGEVPVSECSPGDADGDGVVTVDEIVATINRALEGCG